MELDSLKRAVLEALGPRPTINRRRAVAQALRTLADEQERIATAQVAQARKPPDQRLGRRRAQAGPGAPPGAGVRWSNRQLQIGRSLYYAIGSPRKVRFDFDGSYTTIREGDEYTVMVRPGHIPRVTCTRAHAVGAWEEGWRPAEVVGRAIRFHAAATAP